MREQKSLFNFADSVAEEIRKDLAGALALYRVPGIGSAFFRSLLNSLGSPANVFNASRNSLESVPGIGPHTAEAIHHKSSIADAERLIKKLEDCEAGVLSIWDPQYPTQLKEIHDPPALLFVRRELVDPDPICIAIVGTRTPSIYGNRQAHFFAEELAKHGIVTVSGMARGIDSSAHEGALSGGGKTYAVFGCGIDQIYPRENKELAARIQSSGALISEYLPDTKPDPGLFPRRNRIISGLSRGVLIVQGEEKSGALITAKTALEQNREVFALPGGVDDRRSRGPHKLIREGATLVTTVEDILAEFNLTSGGKPSEQIKKSLPALNDSEKTIIKHLNHEATHIDKLVQELKLPVSAILADLLNLEMKGWIDQLPGKLFVLK